MKYLAAYSLLVLSGKKYPDSADMYKLLEAAGVRWTWNEIH